EGAFSDAEVQEWLDKQIRNYEEFGFGLWAVTLKGTGEMIGQCGLTMQSCKDRQVLEVGYLFQKSVWGNGYATEAAIACRDYAFDKLNASEVFSIIRDTNTASQNVAKRNGMTLVDTFNKNYRSVDMPHFLFSVKRQKPNGEFCTCDCYECEFHPRKHNNECTACIGKNLSNHEIPNCFFSSIGNETDAKSNYSFYKFAEKVMKQWASEERRP
ncbi:MAG: GNAT family N-acetyltransferase, partial [Clostridiales bacterium]|nr:GNAT family N-acetyltransferase [Clostridiales bacterium]